MLYAFINSLPQTVLFHDIHWFFLLTVIPITLVSVWAGDRFSRYVQEKGENNKSKRSTLVFSGSVLTFVSMAAVLLFLYFQQARIYKNIQNDLKTIHSLRIVKESDGVTVQVMVIGETPDKYELDVEVFSDGYVKEKVWEAKQEIPLRHEHQIFDFKISYEKLAALYREALKKYVPAFRRKLTLHEVIVVDVSLKLIGKGKMLDKSAIKELNLPVHRGIITDKLTFICDEEKCIVDNKKDK